MSSSLKPPSGSSSGLKSSSSGSRSGGSSSKSSGSTLATYQQPLSQPGRGAGEAAHPFAVTVEAEQPEALIPEGYGIKYHAYHTLTEGVFLPTGTVLPGGAVFTMSAVLDFPTWIPPGSKMPGGMVTPVSMQKAEEKKKTKIEAVTEPLCLIM